MLQWTDTKAIKNIVLAVEPGIDEVIINNLRHMDPFNDENKWCFTSIAHSDLLNTITNPDVLLISRFLPGDKANEVLNYVRGHFLNTSTHIVLLVGTKNEQCRHYIRLAKDMGFENIVTGDLPGDLPYTLDQALQYPYAAILQGTQGDFLKTERVELAPGRGIIIASAGAKGGVGKTSVAAGVTQALALRGIQVTAADADFSRQDLTAFFKINSRGFVIPQDRHDPGDIKRSIVPVHKNIYVLPGSGTKLPMNWPDSEEIKLTLDSLRDTAPFVIVDTPSDLNCPHTPIILQEADIVLVNIDQSRFTDQDIFDYGAFLLEIGIVPEKVKLVVNRYSRKLMPVREIVRAFNQGIRGNVQVVAMIPEQWEKYALASHKGEIPGVAAHKGPWQALIREVADTNPGFYRPKKNYHAWYKREV